MNQQDNNLCEAAAEQWRPVYINGEKTRYEVSDQGRVRSRSHRIYCREDGTMERREVKYVLKPRKKQIGYLHINLCLCKRCYDKHVHRLVAEAFLGTCPKGLQVDHINGNPADNRLENLRYVTGSENCRNCKRPRSKFAKGKKGIGLPLFSLYIQPDGFEISYRCQSWSDFVARTGANAQSTQNKLSASPDRRIHLRCGFTVWQEPISQE